MLPGNPPKIYIKTWLFLVGIVPTHSNEYTYNFIILGQHLFSLIKYLFNIKCNILWIFFSNKLAIYMALPRCYLLELFKLPRMIQCAETFFFKLTTIVLKTQIYNHYLSSCKTFQFKYVSIYNTTQIRCPIKDKKSVGLQYFFFSFNSPICM